MSRQPHIGPMTDTELEWTTLPDGLLRFKAVLGGFPRILFGKDRAKMEAMASEMKQGLA